MIKTPKKLARLALEMLGDAKAAEQKELEKKNNNDAEIAKMQAQQAAAEKQKARAEYEKSPEGIAEKNSQAASDKKLESACNHFISDLGRREAFKEPKLLHAVNTLPNVVMCTYSMTEPGVYADTPKVITITGNTQNGVYNY
jgi:PDZ domain-containing secreted protein